MSDANQRSTISATDLAGAYQGGELTDTQARQVVNDRPRNEIAAFAIQTFEQLPTRLKSSFLFALELGGPPFSVAADATVDS